MSVLVYGCLELRAGKSQVGENSRVSVIEDSLFCPIPHRGGPQSRDAAAVVAVEQATAPTG